MTFPHISPLNLRFCVATAQLLGRSVSITNASMYAAGAVIWNHQKECIVSTGFSRISSEHMMLHAETDALQKMVFWTSWNTIMISTHAPCLECAKFLLRRKIAGVYFLENIQNAAGVMLLRHEHVHVRRLIFS